MPGRTIVQPLALTLGEPAGIGPDLALAIWRRRAELDLPAFYIVGDPDFLRRRAARLGLDLPMTVVTPETAAATFRTALPIVDDDVAVSAEPGARTGQAHRPPSARSAGRSPTCLRARPQPSSPIPSPRTCFTTGALPSRVIPNSWPNWSVKRPERRCGR